MSTWNEGAFQVLQDISRNEWTQANSAHTFTGINTCMALYDVKRSKKAQDIKSAAFKHSCGVCILG